MLADSSYYGPTAWQADKEEPLRKRRTPDTRSARFRFQWAAGQKLSKNFIQDLVPGDFLETWTPDQDEDTNWYVEKGRGAGKKKVPIAWMDHESVRWATLPGSTWRWVILKGLAKFLLTVGLIFFTLASISLVFMVDRSWHSVFFETYLPVVIKVGGPCMLIWGGISLLERLFPAFIYKSPKGPLWELNRRTGMVTAFCNPKKKVNAGKIAWQSPFAEFDCYVHSGPTHQGLPLYYAVIVHSFREEAMYLTDFQAASASDEDHKALWNFWLQYMDSTATLPDIPLFEPHRHKDPVTAEYDKANGRSPRYWRDMDEATYKQKTDEMYKRVMGSGLAL